MTKDNKAPVELAEDALDQAQGAGNNLKQLGIATVQPAPQPGAANTYRGTTTVSQGVLN